MLPPTGPMRFIRRASLFTTAFLGLSFGGPCLSDAPALASPLAHVVAGVDNDAPSMSALRSQPVARRRNKQAAVPPLPDKGLRTGNNVTLRAALAPGGASLAEGLSWRVLKLSPSQSDQELVWSGGGGEPKIYLKPGLYYVEATWGLATNGQQVEVLADKPVDSIIPLNAGTLLVHALAVAGGIPLDDVFFTLRSAEPGTDPSKEIGRSSLPQAVFHVPAGKYRLSAQHGLATIDMPVTIAAGAENQAEAVLNSGTLALTARAKEDSPVLSGATFMIFEDGETGSRREIVRSKLDEPKFSLPGGRYRVAAVLGMARVDAEITVKAGEQTTQDLILDAGGVRLGSVMTGNNSPLDSNLLYRVYSLSAQDGSANQEMLTSTLPSPTLFLPSGRYRIESQYGWHNARQTREVDVAAGEVLDVAFEHKASDVKLRLVPRPGGETMDRVKWTLKYNGGGTVLISQDAAPALILQAGSYQAMAQHETKTYSQTFEAASNQEQIIEIIAQ